MKFKIYLTLFLMLIGLLVIPIQGIEIQSENQILSEKHKFLDQNSSKFPNTSCSVFTVEYNGSVFFGNNEDDLGLRRNSRVWFVPALDNSTYGCAYVGFYDNLPGGDDLDNIAIGGINTQGLCFDANGIPLGWIESNINGPIRSNLKDWEAILSECASVEEVIQWYKSHNMGGYWSNQVHWADATGDAVVIGPGYTKWIAFTRKVSDYLISTNFNLVGYNLSDPNTSYPCTRYTAMKTLLEMQLSNDDLALEQVRDILDSVHFPGTSEYLGTVYSNIFDLKSGDIYFYILGDYSEVFKLNLFDELEKGAHEMRITMDGSLSPKSSIGFEALLCIISLILIIRVYRPKTK
ncbi:MAG: hypothetical protein KAT16_06280 [Candidatus Heimdallarchaeota archaeon]|nr:hypothetical protein [Candidatus Heimdallarchaeota archaeon]